ncbi:MAG: FUSC family protein [Rhodanobacteraceae bacterium]
MTPAGRLRESPLLQTLLQMQRPDVPWRVALRNTAAIVLPLAIGAATDHLAAGLGVSAGALNTMFADQPGPYRLRMRRLLLTALAAGVAAFAGSVLGEWPPVLLVVAALWGFAAALLVALGPHATRAGLISMILLVVMGADPRAGAQAWQAALLISAGGVLQTLFAIAAWPLQRYRPERMAVANALRQLASLARHNVAPGDEVLLPPSLNDLQSLLYGSGRARGRAMEAFQVLAQLAERMRIELLALADLQSGCKSRSLFDALQAIRQAAAGVLDVLALALEQASPPQPADALSHYAAAAELMDEWRDPDGAQAAQDVAKHPDSAGHGWPVANQASTALDSSGASPDTRRTRDVEKVQDGTFSTNYFIAQIAKARVASLGGQLRATARNAGVAGSRGELSAQRAEFRLPRVLRPANPLATLRANLNFDSVAFRHAVRCGVCLAVALALSQALPLSRGYWMPMTVAIVLRADFGATWRFGLLRVVGTLSGLLLTTGLLHFGFDEFWEALALFTVLCFAYRELATVHYGIAVACLTGLVVILLSFYGVAPETSMSARATDTVLGSALALAAYLLWPTWERGRERAVLAKLLDAYRDYLASALRGDARARFETRITARAARSNAQASLERLRHEPRGKEYLPRAEALVAHANRFMRAAMALEAARGDGPERSQPAEVTAFSDRCAEALTEAALVLRDARAVPGSFHLRDAQHALAAALRAPSDTLPVAFAAALLDASDRIADSIDSLLHVLRPGTAPAIDL